MTEPRWVKVEDGPRVGAVCMQCERFHTAAVYACANEEALEQAWKVAEQCCKPRLCERCHEKDPRPYRTVCEACMDAEQKERERQRFEKARKLTLAEFEAETPGAMLTKDGETWYPSFDDLVEGEYEEDPGYDGHGWEIPEYIWATREHRISFDAADLIENACSDMHEDASEDISASAFKRLQKFLDLWCKAHSPTSYSQDFSRAIVLSPEERAEYEKQIKEWMLDAGLEENENTNA